MKRWKWLWVVAVAGSILLCLRCGKDSGSGPEQLRLLLNVDSVDLEVSSVQQFEATYGDDAIEVIWDVDGIVGGGPWKGMITGGGLYIAPDAVPAGGTVRVRALAVEDTSVQASATVTITMDGDPVYVTVEPDTATVAVAGFRSFTGDVIGCTSNDISWSIRAIGSHPLDIGEILADGTYLAPSSTVSDIEIFIRAASISCPGKSGIAKVIVPSQPRAFTVELEDYIDSHDSLGVPLTEPIDAVICGYASAGKSVIGLDNPGEYIVVPMIVPGSGTYVATVRYASWALDTLHVRLEIDGCGQPGQDEYQLMEGTGLG
jgi:hypothetical protein